MGLGFESLTAHHCVIKKIVLSYNLFLFVLNVILLYYSNLNSIKHLDTYTLKKVQFIMYFFLLKIVIRHSS